MQDVGEADAFGHRHKANVGEALAAELKARTGIETVALGADLRPALRRARLARLDGRDDVRQRRDGPHPATGVTGRMVAIQDGKYAHTTLPQTGTPARRVDVADMYNVERFRPRYEGKLGDPMLLVGLHSGVATG